MITLRMDQVSEIKLPASLAVCPICGKRILLEEITGMVQDELCDLWIADEISVTCETEPDIDNRNWNDWMSWHFSTPYIDWLPVSQKVEAWLKANYRFVDAPTPDEEREKLATWNAGEARKIIK